VPVVRTAGTLGGDGLEGSIVAVNGRSLGRQGFVPRPEIAVRGRLVSATIAAMEFKILGPLEVIGPGGVVNIGSALQRAILAILVLHVGETVSTDHLMDELWGDDPPPSAHHAIGVHVSRLRRTLGVDCIESQPRGYRLRAEGSVIDLGRFEALIAEASRAFAGGDPRAAATALVAGLALWRGAALGDLASSHAAQAERARLDELRALALERRVDAELACGSHLELVPDLRRLIGEMPLREVFHARLMLALYRSGRQAEALEVYHRAREVLDRELGVDPGTELETLQRAVLDHDPGLDLAVAQVRDRPAEVATPATPPAPRPRDARRTVTTLIADMRGSTLAGEPLDPESARVPLDRCFREMRPVLERHGGAVERVVGDAVLAVFGIPLVHEDDALRAVRAALEMRDALAALNDRLKTELRVRIAMRVGVNTGEVVAARDTDSASKVTGDAVNVAARLQQAAGPDEILLGEATYDLVRWAISAEPTGPMDPRHRPRESGPFRLLAVAGGIAGHTQRFDSPLVGRERERRRLESAFEQVAADGTCQLFTLLGPAGVGKSRLVHEFLRWVRPEAEVLRGRCPPYGERVAFWPVAETIKQAAGISDVDTAVEVRDKIGTLLGADQRASSIADHLASVIGLSETPSSSEETFAAIRRVYENIARAQPLAIVFDDVQWAEPMFLDLIEHLADALQGTPVLLLVIARPELLDERPGWAGGKLRTTSVVLEPLDEGEVSSLVANLLHGSAASPSVERKIAEAAEGNPLFVEEFLAMLIDDGLVRRARNEWIGMTDLATIPTPASIKALLAARLDRLPILEREVLELAAVVGKTFTREAVEALADPDVLPDVAGRLESVVRREIIRPDRSSADVPNAYRFRHILIRDAAYAALSKGDRAEIHERFADFQERAAGDRLAEYEEVIGYHLEQATHYRQGLGRNDERTRNLARRAAQLLGAAGIHAIQRGDALASSRLLERCRAMWRQPTQARPVESLPGDA
jgi:class 3 adenylate cyclase/DNA-binding winged helix-turn-helix (wHTH) protein